MLNDIVNSIKATLYDRASSPLFGAFAVSWAIWNYRLLVVLTSSGEFQAKLRHIDDVLYPTWLYVAGVGIAFPLITALIFIYLYPWPARWVYGYALEQGKKLRELRQKVEGVELLTAEESRSLRQRHVVMQIEFDRQIKTLQEERDASQQIARNVTEQSRQMTERAARTAEVEQQLAQLDEKSRREIEALRKSEEAHAARGNALALDLESLQRDIAALADEDRLKLAQRRAQERTKWFAEGVTPTSKNMAGTLWRLTFNPQLRPDHGTKLVHLLPDGVIEQGKNQNEDSWRIGAQGSLEFVQSDGRTHSRFVFDPQSRQWEAQTDDPTLGMKTSRQYMGAPS